MVFYGWRNEWIVNEEVFLVFGSLLDLRKRIAVSIEQEFRELSSFNLLGQKTQVIIFLALFIQVPQDVTSFS